MNQGWLLTSCMPLCPVCVERGLWSGRSAGGHSLLPINTDYQSGEAKKGGGGDLSILQVPKSHKQNFKGAKWIVFAWILFWFLLFCSSWRSVVAVCRPSGLSSGPSRESPALPAGWELRLGRWSKATYTFKVPKEAGKILVFCGNKVGCNLIIGFVLQPVWVVFFLIFSR